MSLSATIKVILKATQTRALDLASASSPLSQEIALAFADGAGANQANLIWHDQRTLAASASENLDLAGSLTDVYGQTATFARIKALLIKSASGNTNNVNVSREATNGVPLFLAAGDGLLIPPGGVFLWASPSAAGVALTAGTADLLTVANSAAGTSVTYDIYVLGAAT
jgi:hypothetical protein